jgi:DNA-binding CsgD family transcriptional regulator
MDEGWVLLEGAVARARELGLEVEAARGFRMIATSASVLVEYDRAAAWLREGLEYARRVELWNHHHYMAGHLAHVSWATGDWDLARALAEQALADGRGGITTRITCLHVLGFVAVGRGEWPDAQAVLEEARELGQRMAELQRLAPALWGLAELALRQGDHAAAAHLSEEALVASERRRDAAYAFPFLVTGTRAHLGLGDPTAAERWAERVAARPVDRNIPGTLPAIDHGRGLVELARGSTGRARASLEAAATGWGERRRTWEGTTILIDLARCAIRSNRRSDAARHAAGARDAAVRLGATPLVEEAEGVLRSLRRRDSAAEPWAPLTAREFAVARLVSEGLTNAAIGERLEIAPKTVAAHVEHILAKLGVGRRAEIAAWTATRPVLHSGPHGDDREE